MNPISCSLPEVAATSPLAASRQLLVVRAATWESSVARLQRFTRQSAASGWQPVGSAIPTSLGHAGLAWGSGLHPAGEASGKIKREGDGCAPAGIFAITELFGNAAPDSEFARAARLPYRSATPELLAIDDPASAYYNRIVDRREIAAPDWATHEDMLRRDRRYTVGAVLAHNAAPPVPGAGSCIFLHVWQAPGVPTAGCTAGDLADITDICAWLDGAASPLLVQLPEAEYGHFQAAWALP